MKKDEELNTLGSLISQIVKSAMRQVADEYVIPRVKEFIKDNRDEPDFYTSKELSENFGLDSSFLYHYRKKGLIEYVQIGRKIIYPREAVHEFINEHANHKKDS